MEELEIVIERENDKEQLISGLEEVVDEQEIETLEEQIREIQPELAEKTITANGTYNAESDNVYGYSSVNVNVPTYETEVEELKAIEDGFVTCKLPGAYYNDRVTEVGVAAFRYHSAMKSVDLPNVTVTRDGSFYFCTALASVNLPKTKNVGYQTFFRCTSLTTIDVPVATSISSQGFAYCSSLKQLDLPIVVTIGTYAFQNCSQLNALILRSETVATLANTNAFTGTPIDNGKGYIYVPDELVESYKTAANWSAYADQIKGISELE